MSVVLHNTDDHLRNHGFLRTGSGWSLSPAFDINPNPSLNDCRATSIFGECGKTETRGVKEIASASGIAMDSARSIAVSVLQAMSAWKTLARMNGCTEVEIGLFEPVFADRCSAVSDAFSC